MATTTPTSTEKRNGRKTGWQRAKATPTACVMVRVTTTVCGRGGTEIVTACGRAKLGGWGTRIEMLVCCLTTTATVQVSGMCWCFVARRAWGTEIWWHCY